ncbi:hypothetical protein KQI77_02840 [Clostridium sp. MSJ-8]|uniref:hypothetical protein n=1 Tax=Clostridium sp. MSJ-8 TaxID=2841510 RepID=UPI001C0F009E|nr:hypothetical protein [Clostridium sp. MSJ-8]MBU5487099.1 hypothetical protein [Clostridium sp. MSJ-8]
MEKYFNDSQNKYNKKLIIMSIIPITIIAKILQFTVLPDKYFWDSARINSMVTGSGIMPSWEGSYKIAANVFKKLNIFGFTDLEDWAVLIATVFSLLLVIMLTRPKELDIIQTAFVLASIGLLNIYIFNISKDIIQYFIFMLIYIVLMMDFLKPIIKVILSFLIFYWESTFFRSYYLIIGVLAVVLYFVFSIRAKKDKKMTVGSVLLIVAIAFATIYAFLLAASVVMPADYKEVIYVRQTNLNDVAVSQIENVFPIDGTLNNFMINYVINAVRMMIPVELIRNGVFYLPFVVYQIFILFYLVKTIRGLRKEMNETAIIALSVFTAYLLGSFIFEPDFGSFVRHEAATFPVLHLMVLDKCNIIKATNNKEVAEVE